MPFADPANDETRTHPRRTAAIRLSPETVSNIKLGSLVTAACALVAATVFVWTVKTNSEQALQQIRELRGELSPVIEQHRRLWYEHERVAQQGSYPRVGP